MAIVLKIKATAKVGVYVCYKVDRPCDLDLH